MAEKASNSGQKRLKKLIVLLLVLLLLGAAAGGGWWYATRHNATANEPAPPPPPAPPVFMALDTFTVNLQNPDNDPNRVLYVGFTLRLPDQETLQLLTSYLPEVRSRLLLLLSQQDATALGSEQGKQRLMAAIKQTLAPPFVPGQNPQVITDVLFTTFILR